MTDRTPTFADLCCAIAEGNIAATQDGSMYLVSARDVRRYLNKFRSLPAISSVEAQAPCSDPGDWSTPVQTSVA